MEPSLFLKQEADMHVPDITSLASVIEDSVHYQNEHVYTIYGIIFLTLGVICATYYWLCLKQSNKRLRKRIKQ